MDERLFWAWLALALAALVTYLWRAAGVALSGRIDPAGPIFAWVGAVTYALLAGLVSRMIVLPSGPLRQTLLGDRLIAVAVATAVFFVLRRNLLLGVAAGAVTLAWLAF